MSIIITTASWEDRFILGLAELIIEKKPKQIFAFYFKEYAGDTSTFREATNTLCKNHNIELKWLELSFAHPADSWKKSLEFLKSIQTDVYSVQVDITTMPREIIWTVFNILSEKDYEVTYTYFKPESYNQNWLSQEPGTPRLVYKMGGISKLNVSNILLIQTGYDIDRIVQITHEFNPEKTLLAIQSGNQFGNEKENREKCDEFFQREPNIELFEIDAYSPDHGAAIIEQKIRPFIQNHNVLAASVGPKLGSVALFKLFQKYSNEGFGLIYAPSNKFNPEYSTGIGKCYSNKLFENN